MTMTKRLLAVAICAAMSLCAGCGVVDKIKEKYSEAESVIDKESKEYLEKYNPTSLAKDEAAEIFEYLKAKDKEKLTALMSKSAGSQSSLDGQWDKFFEFIDGDIESYEYLDMPREGMTIDKDGVITDSHLAVDFKKVKTSTGKEYGEIGYFQQRKYPKDPDIEGINLFYAYVFDEEGHIKEECCVGRMPNK
ncbi:MAG: DUF5104 domain-containing protein [Ruminococcus sp.]|nr:DUF5104 domain-containing protein [Ruminococcus sp.]